MTKIDYIDECVNVICGCTNGCYYCWARNRYAPRFAHRCKLCGQFKPHFHEERLKLIDRIKKPSIVGLNFMGDTWDDDVRNEWRDKIFSRLHYINNYVILTKQPQNIGFRDFNFTYEIKTNLWVGVSIDNIHDMTRWVSLSQKEYIHNKIISFEPVLNFNPIFAPVNSLEDIFRVYGMPKWFIVGDLTKSDNASMELSRIEAMLLIKRLKKLPKCPPIFVKGNVGLKDAPQEFPAGLKPNKH